MNTPKPKIELVNESDILDGWLDIQRERNAEVAAHLELRELGQVWRERRKVRRGGPWL
jgi:hypothetical protein